MSFISGAVDLQGCGHRVLSGGVGMPGLRSASTVCGYEVGELQGPGLLGGGGFPSRIPIVPARFCFCH